MHQNYRRHHENAEVLAQVGSFFCIDHTKLCFKMLRGELSEVPLEQLAVLIGLGVEEAHHILALAVHSLEELWLVSKFVNLSVTQLLPQDFLLLCLDERLPALLTKPLKIVLAHIVDGLDLCIQLLLLCLSVG